MIWGLGHAIKVVHSIRGRNLSVEQIRDKLEMVDVPRILYGIFCGILGMLYGLELHNYWMFWTILTGVALNLILVYLIWRVTKEW